MSVSYYIFPGLKKSARTEIVYNTPRDYVHVIEVILKYTNTSFDNMVKANRDRGLVYVRQLICYFLRQTTNLTLREIGVMIGRKDHTSVLHGIRSIEGFLTYDDMVINDVKTLRSII